MADGETEADGEEDGVADGETDGVADGDGEADGDTEAEADGEADADGETGGDADGDGEAEADGVGVADRVLAGEPAVGQARGLAVPLVAPAEAAGPDRSGCEPLACGLPPPDRP